MIFVDRLQENFLIFQQNKKIHEFAETRAKMCQIFKFKIDAQQIKMTYIEQFLSEHIITFYLKAIRQGQEQRQFVDYRTPRNFFTLTWQILLFGDNITHTSGRTWLIALIKDNLLMPYDDLREATLPLRKGESQALAFIKKGFGYIYVQMHQIMIRIILAHLAIAEFNADNQEVDTAVREIGYIYPALKAEISFGMHEINLADWFDHYLTLLIKEKTPKALFHQFLQKVRTVCRFLGPIDRVFQKLSTEAEDDQKTREKEYESSIYEQSRSESMSKHSQERIFSEFQLFRKKKKILKEKVKDNYHMYNTPFKQDSLPKLPQTDKTDLKNQSSLSQCSAPKQPSLAFSKLAKKYKKPMVRTMYQGITKTFVPKRTIGINGFTAEQYIQNLTASSSLTTQESLYPFEIGRRSKLSKPSFQTEQIGKFCVPETPKQQPLRKVSGEKPFSHLKI